MKWDEMRWDEMKWNEISAHKHNISGEIAEFSKNQETHFVTHVAHHMHICVSTCF